MKHKQVGEAARECVIDGRAFAVQAASSKASNYVDGLDVIVGSAGSAADLAHLKTVTGLPLGAAAPGSPLNVTESLGSK